MSTIPTIPAVAQQASVEDITWGVDETSLLTGVQTVTAFTATLANSTGTLVTLADAPTLAGNIISQRVRAGVLSEGYYTLTWKFTPSGTSNVFASSLTINVPS